MPSGKSAILIFCLASLTAASDHASSQCLGNMTTCDATSFIQVHQEIMKERRATNRKTTQVQVGDNIYHGTRGILGAANAIANPVNQGLNHGIVLALNKASLDCVPLTGRSFFTTKPRTPWFYGYMFADKANEDHKAANNPATGYAVGFQVTQAPFVGECSRAGTRPPSRLGFGGNQAPGYHPGAVQMEETCLCQDGPQAPGVQIRPEEKCNVQRKGPGICPENADLIDSQDEQIWARTNKFVACYVYTVQAYYNVDAWNIVNVAQAQVQQFAARECQVNGPTNQAEAIQAWGQGGPAYVNPQNQGESDESDEDY